MLLVSVSKALKTIGNGLSLIWKAETGYDMADGNAWGGARNAYIGLAGDWGTFLYGIQDTPMKMSAGSLDLFGDQLGDYNFSTNTNNALLGPGFIDLRASNAIAYISPNMNGLTFAGAIIPGEGAGGADGLADGYSVAAMYSNNGLYLSAAYEHLNDDFADGISYSIVSPSQSRSMNSDGEWTQWRVGAGYTMNNITVNFVYEDQERLVSSGNREYQACL